MFPRSKFAAKVFDDLVASTILARRRLYQSTCRRILSSAVSPGRSQDDTLGWNNVQYSMNQRSGLSTSARSYADDTHIMSCPLGDLDLPVSPFLAHYIMDNWHKYTDKVALVNGETGAELTYGQLQTQIVKAGSALVRLGFTKGDVMMLVTPNSPEFVIMYMAAASIGMIISAVNPLYTKDELVHALRMSESKLLVFSPLLVDVVKAALSESTSVQKSIALGPVSGHETLESLLSDDGKAFNDHIDYNSKEDTITLPFSSGTSGRPKGVILTSHCMVSNLEQIGSPSFLNPSSDDVYVGVLPYFHIFAQVVVMALGLRHGTKTVIMGKFDPVTFLDIIQKYKPSHLHVVPPIMLFLAKHPIIDKYDLSSVRSYFYAAAPMSPATLAEVQSRIGKDAKFTQGYGMTELSPSSHVNPFHGGRPETVGPVVHNTQFKIQDPLTKELLPANQEGELCIRGPQVMKGYLKNEQANRETIIDGWLHTGDIAYYEDDGFVTITDRLKELIKFKGYQVAPAELEDLLLGHPSVQDAAVIGKPDEAAGELPRAYVVLKPGVKTTEEEIQNFIKEKASSYKQLRGGVEFRTEIPKAASGKILRRLLRDELRQQTP